MKQQPKIVKQLKEIPAKILKDFLHNSICSLTSKNYS